MLAPNFGKGYSQLDSGAREGEGFKSGGANKLDFGQICGSEIAL